jgi:hypothetical protein
MKDIYTFRELLAEYQQISIPKIQRDYAQGRGDDKAKDVRENFINDIFSGNVKSLDFIFGTACELPGENQKAFLPLDGQQRLTTLFLLYLYGKKFNKITIDNLCKFTYETRKAARDFCKEIVEQKWQLKDNEKLSESIIRQKWFINYWLNDPTVEGMLTMLDTIHEKTKTNSYPKLDDITFRFFDMNEHNLSDSLYIKMNSRGKPLTAFENLKATIDNVLKGFIGTKSLESFNWCGDEELKRKNGFYEKWKYCIDRQWTDMFWRFRENGYLPDQPFIRFLSNMLSAYWIDTTKVAPNDDGERNDFLRFLLNINGSEDYISFDKFKQFLTSSVDCHDVNKDKYAPFVFLADCLNTFYLLFNVDNLPEICRPSWENDNYNLVENVIKCSNPTNKERAMFYALIKCPYVSFSDLEEKKKRIEHWMRIFWNIVEQEQERVRNFIGAVHLINELSSKIINNKNEDIYVWFNNGNRPSTNFMKDQIEEEIAKAKRIINNQFSEESIKNAEKHPLLRGCIRALFENDDCLNVSFGQSIDDRIKLLNELYKEGNDKDYNLVKVLLSKYKKEYPDGKIRLKRNTENWKELITNKLKDCFRETKGNRLDDSSYSWINLLTNNNLIENSRNDGKILGVYNNSKIVLWGTGGCNWNANGNVILDEVHNNHILSVLLEEKKIKCNQKIENCDFFWGWDINFEYNNIQFQWNEDNYIYYLRDGKRLEKDKESSENCQKYYCFKADGPTPNLFIEELNKLIYQV